MTEPTPSAQNPWWHRLASTGWRVWGLWALVGAMYDFVFGVGDWDPLSVVILAFMGAVFVTAVKIILVIHAQLEHEAARLAQVIEES